MIGTSKSEYVLIRISIACLRAVTPLSTIYCCARLFFPPSFRQPALIPLDIWALGETAFFFLGYLPLRHRCQRPVIHPPPASREERQELFRRCQETLQDPDGYLSKWFRDAPPTEIKRENVKEFFTWAYFNSAGVDEGYEEELDGYVDGLQELVGRPFEQGRGRAQCLRLTLNEVRMLHRPLVWYLVCSSKTRDDLWAQVSLTRG